MRRRICSFLMLGGFCIGAAAVCSVSLAQTPQRAVPGEARTRATAAEPLTGQMGYAASVTPLATLTIAPIYLAVATVGTAYSSQLTASGGTAPYSFSVVAGSLPAGLTLSSGGLISGTATAAAANANFTVAGGRCQLRDGPVGLHTLRRRDRPVAGRLVAV